MKEMRYCELVHTTLASENSKPKKYEFITRVTVMGIHHDPTSEDYIVLRVDDRIEQGAVLMNIELYKEKEWAKFIGAEVEIKGFVIPAMRKHDTAILFGYSVKEVSNCVTS